MISDQLQYRIRFGQHPESIAAITGEAGNLAEVTAVAVADVDVGDAADRHEDFAFHLGLLGDRRVL